MAAERDSARECTRRSSKRKKKPTQVVGGGVDGVENMRQTGGAGQLVAKKPGPEGVRTQAARDALRRTCTCLTRRVPTGGVCGTVDVEVMPRQCCRPGACWVACERCNETQREKKRVLLISIRCDIGNFVRDRPWTAHHSHEACERCVKKAQTGKLGYRCVRSFGSMQPAEHFEQQAMLNGARRMK